MGGPVADALWLQGFGVALLTLCLFVGGKQKKGTKLTISTRKKNEHSVPSSSRVHRTGTHTVLGVQPHPFANLAQVPLFPVPSATHPGAALGRLGVVRGLPRGQVCLAPWAAQGPVSVTMVSRGVLRDHGGSGCLYPFGTGGYPACYQCGVSSAQCGGIGSPGADVPLCQVTLLASSPSLHHAYHGSLVTPSVCFWTPLCLPVPVCVMCDVTTCGSVQYFFFTYTLVE